MYESAETYQVEAVREITGTAEGGEKSRLVEEALKILDHRERTLDFGVDITGTLENTSDRTWSGISIEVELFDAGGQFVDECSDYLSGGLDPGERENFKVRCGGCKDSPLPAYSNYTIRVADAHDW